LSRQPDLGFVGGEVVTLSHSLRDVFRPSEDAIPSHLPRLEDVQICEPIG